MVGRQDFWKEVFTFNGSVTPYIQYRVLGFVAFAWAVGFLAGYEHFKTGFGVAPYEIIGVVLALLLVLRTNSGYDRWYEGRKLWGGIVNQSRNLALIGLNYGPDDVEWRTHFARWVALFSHVCRLSLRGERDAAALAPIIGPEEAARVVEAQHMPTYVAGRIDALLRQALVEQRLDRFAFIQAQNERAQLIDHVGGCERILKTPLARVFSIKIRRFLFLYLIVLPVAIVDKAGDLTPIIIMLVAYPLLSLDQIGVELQYPFSPQRLSHLPLESICSTISDDVLALLDEPPETAGTTALPQSMDEPQFAAAR
jgi:ion channel-forming bestrophin family protein